MALPGGGYYAIQGQVTVGLWRRIGGVWSMFATEVVEVYSGTGTSRVRKTIQWQFQQTYSLGSGVTDVGITIESATDAASADAILLSWSASQAGGERTASPGGEQAAVVVRP